jgi:2-polyprenyl-3-methyl-5-hydroxy-6-metoxy-1,4-benzoquinol methylase
MKNPAFGDAGDAYYIQGKEYLLPFVPDGQNAVLDLGCGAGGFGRGLMKAGKASRLVGVEIFEPAAKEAMKYYESVHVGDIEEMDLPYDKCFDVVICGDVLEHLKDPQTVVKRIHGWLKDGGRVVCCVPNVRYWENLVDLVFKGDWRYVSEGIMDQTHLRFFTTKSFKRTLADARFTVERQGMTYRQDPKQHAFNRVTFGLFNDFIGYQMLFTARKI